MIDGMFGPWPLICGVTVVLQAIVFVAFYQFLKERNK